MVPMELCASGGIFQTNVDEILSDIEGVKTYIDDILVLGKGSFSQHIYQLRVILVDSPKCSFGLTDIPYLGALSPMYMGPGVSFKT